MNKYFFIALIFMVLSQSEAKAQTQISFQVSFSEPQAHYADVVMKLSGNKKEFVDVKMPVWAPGSYLVREFAKNVEGFYAKGANNLDLQAEKIDKNTWRIAAGKNESITIGYKVYAFEVSVRTSFIDESHAFLSPTGIFMYVDGLVNAPATIEIKPYEGWTKVSTGLEAIKGRKFTYHSPNFDVLYDSPIEVGNQDIFEFDAAGVRHEVAMYGGGNYDKNRLASDMAKIVEACTSIFGENPNKKYVFIVHNFQRGGGGLEHLNSTVLGASRMNYNNEAGYNSFLSLVAHEYFHLWNVKRLRPEALGPFNYDAENYTRDLWIAEGFTAYYDNLMLRRTGFYSPEKYLDVLCADINTVENQPGSKVQPVSEASFDAWIKYYRQNENSRNSTISYYNKGALLGAVLDLEILNATKGTKGLDDVLKSMYDEFYKKHNRGFTSEEFKKTVEQIAGISLDNFYKDYVHGTAPIRFDVHLDHAGLRLVDDNTATTATLGLSSVLREGRLMVSSVTRDGAAWKDGINVNDEIIAVDGYRVLAGAEGARSSDLERIIAAKKPGDKISVMLSRDGLIRTQMVTLLEDTTVRYRIEAVKNPTLEQLAIRKKWLSM